MIPVQPEVEDVVVRRKDVTCERCGGRAELIRYHRERKSFVRPSEVVRCGACESWDNAVWFVKTGSADPAYLAGLSPERRAELERGRAALRAGVVRAADPEAWTAFTQKKRADGRADQARRDREERVTTFRMKVWPELERVYGASGWREIAHELCLKNRIAVSDRDLDRLLQDGREAGVVPNLRSAISSGVES